MKRMCDWEVANVKRYSMICFFTPVYNKILLAFFWVNITHCKERWSKGMSE